MHRRASTAFKMALLALAVSLLVYVTVSYAQSYQNEAALPEAGSGGGYGVMDTNVTGCQLINAPGAYVLIGNVSGASTLPYWPGATACILINNTSNVNFNCNGFTINVSGTSVYPYFPASVVVQYSNNVTVRNCRLAVSYSSGVLLYNATNSTVRNNSAFGPGSSLAGFSDYDYGATANINNSFINNSASGTWHGMDSGGTNSTYANNTATDCIDYAFYFGCQNSKVSGNIALNGGFRIGGSGNNITGNLNSGLASDYGFWLMGANNSMVGNNAMNTFFDGFEIDGDSNVLRNNTASGSLDGAGFNINPYYGGSQNVLSDNVAYNNPIGFEVAGYEDEDGTFYVVTSNNLTNNLALNNTGDGFQVALSQDSTLLNNNATGNGCGLSIYDSNDTVISNTHLYNNSYGFNISSFYGGSSNYSMINSIFDNPSGSMENYTNLSINDSVSNVENYSISWTGSPGSIQPNLTSFAQKFVNTSTVSGPVSIDSITWSWTDLESTGHTEANFGLWKYNPGGWAMLNSTLNTDANTLTLANMNPASIYGVLENVTTNCPIINTSGAYAQTADYAGSPNNASPLADSACVKIASSNVVFDCAGHTITDNGTAGTTYGILVATVNNVTVKNCRASNYTYGIYLYQSTNSSIQNNHADYNSNAYGGYGIVLSYSNNNTLYNNSAGYNYFDGISLYSSSNNALVNNSAPNNYFGIRLDTSDHAILSNNNATNNSQYDIELYFSSNNTLVNNIADNSGYSGIYMESSDNNTLVNNSASNNYNYGLEIISSSNNAMYNNSANNNGYFGIYFALSSIQNTVYNNTAMENSRFDLVVGADSPAGCQNNITNTIGSGYRPIYYSHQPVSWDGLDSAEIELCNATGSNITNTRVNGSDTLYNNGFLIQLTNNTAVTSTSSCGNLVGFEIETSDRGTYANDLANNNSGAGFNIGASNALNFINDSAIGNPYAGFIMDVSDSNNFTNSLASGNGQYGYALIDSNSGNMVNDTASGSAEGFYLYGVQGDNFSSCTASGNSVWAFSSEYNSQGNIVQNLNLGNNTVSFDSKDINIRDSARPPEANPPGLSDINRFVNATNSSPDSFLFLNLSYTPADVSSLDEGSLSMAKYSGGWITGTSNFSSPFGADTSDKFVFANITNFGSIFGILGTLLPPPSPPPPSSPSPPAASLSLSSSRASCPANEVTITASSGAGTTIRLVHTSPYEGMIDEQTAGSDGTATFALAANGTYEADGSRAGYSPGSTAFIFSTCAITPPEVNVTPPVVPPITPTKPECTSDAECPSTDFCNITAGACQPLKGTCGFAGNHTWNAYECCADADCQPNVCIAHACRILGLTGDSEGLVGGQGTIRATVGGLPLANATLEITEPDGTSFQATTDANGGYVLPFRFEGNYTVRLVSAGVSVRTHLIAVALPPSSRPVERPTVAEEQTKYGWLLPIILVMVLAFLVYWKLRPAGKSRKK